MRLSLATILLAGLAAAPALEAQALDRTMVPRGQLRLQAHPVFDSWSSRYGRAPDGSESVERLGDDLTDPTGLTLFPGLRTLRSVVRSVGGLSGYDPILGPTEGRVTQDLTRVDVGGHLGVFDWLTIGVVVPWVRSRTEIDVLFEPDTIAGDLGLNPRITDPGLVDVFMGSTLTARTQTEANAATACAAGPSAACTAAQELASRAAGFHGSLEAAFGASPFFPLAGTAGGDALRLAAATLSTDLSAAGLTPLAALPLSGEVLTEEGLLLLPQVVGAGIDAAGLFTRKGVYGRGDAEVSIRLRLLDNLAPREGESRPGLGFRLTAHGLMRLPTGAPEHPDVLLDVGTGDAQTDVEGGLAAQLHLGRRIAIFASGFYGEQGATTLVKRVAAPETAIPPVTTRAGLRWQPGSYVGGSVAPVFYVTPSLGLHGEYRYFEKRRDRFELLAPDASLDPTVLEVESGMKIHQVGGGLRYDTVEPWLRGDASRPMELHMRLLTTFRGSGGQTPKSTRIEAGVRLFRRFWGPRR